MSRGLKIIFTLSVLLNILLIGAGLGWHHKRSHHWPGKDVRSEISEESRAVMKQNFKNAKAQYKPIFEEMREDKKAVQAVLEADEFDEAAYDSAVDELLSTRDKLSRTMSGQAKNFLRDLPPEDRKAMAEHMVQKMSGHGHYKKHKKPGERKLDKPSGE